MLIIIHPKAEHALPNFPSRKILGITDDKELKNVNAIVDFAGINNEIYECDFNRTSAEVLMTELQKLPQKD